MLSQCSGQQLHVLNIGQRAGAVQWLRPCIVCLGHYLQKRQMWARCTLADERPRGVPGRPCGAFDACDMAMAASRNLFSLIMMSSCPRSFLKSWSWSLRVRGSATTMPRPSSTSLGHGFGGQASGLRALKLAAVPNCSSMVNLMSG